MAAAKRGKKHRATRPAKVGMKMVALFEGVKGILVLLAGFGLLALIHKDIPQVAEELVRHLHFNPASHYPRIFLDLADRITDARLWYLAATALFYAVVRMVEAVGLWHRQSWAEWFGALTGGMYIPAEVYELFHGLNWAKLIILIVNIWIVAYLVTSLTHGNRREA